MIKSTLKRNVCTTWVLGTLLVVVSAARGAAEPSGPDWRVFQTQAERSRAGRMLLDYQEARILASLARRDAQVAGLRSPAQVAARARAVYVALAYDLIGLGSARPEIPQLSHSARRRSPRFSCFFVVFGRS